MLIGLIAGDILGSGHDSSTSNKASLAHRNRRRQQCPTGSTFSERDTVVLWARAAAQSLYYLTFYSDGIFIFVPI